MQYSNKYSEKFSGTVLSSDFLNFVKPSFLLDCFQAVAERHSTQLGNSRQDLLNKFESYWVLSRITLDIKRYPKAFEECECTTYPLPIKTPFCERDYFITDKQGITICEATSLWSILDAKTHSLKNAKNIGLNMPDICFKEKAFLDINRIVLPDINQMQKLHNIYIKSSLIDENMHINNARYADFISDSFIISEHLEYCFKTIRINFLNQTQEGDTITLYRKNEESDKNAVFIMGIKSDLKPAFSAYLEMEKRV